MLCKAILVLQSIQFAVPKSQRCHAVNQVSIAP